MDGPDFSRFRGGCLNSRFTIVEVYRSFSPFSGVSFPTTMTRKSKSIRAPSHVVATAQEVGRAIADEYDIDVDGSPQETPAPSTIAVDFLIQGYVENNREKFDRKRDAHDGEAQILYSPDN